MSWINNNTIEGVLGQPAPYVTNNPESYGIVFADDIAGQRVVPDLNTLYIIPKAILSKSKNNNNDDAIGQLWFVTSEKNYYQLIDWDNRNNETGWKLFLPLDSDENYQYFKVLKNYDSDIRFKTNIQHINKGILEQLMKLDIISYKWCKSGDEERNTFGVSANQLKSMGNLFEKIVHEKQDENKTLFVEYDRLGVLAIAGLKELEKQRKTDKRYLLKKINEQNTRIEKQQREISLLRKNQIKLENRLKKLELILKKFGY